MKDALQALFARLAPSFEEVQNTDPDQGPQSRCLIIPTDRHVQDMEAWQPAPNRIKANQTLGSVDSFVAYVERFANNFTTIYADVGKGEFKAKIDHYGKDKPTWGDHSAQFAPKPSLEWKAWLAIHKKPQGQLAFAEFIEDRLNDISEPAANKVLKAAIDFQQSESMTAVSVANLDNGNFKFHLERDNTVKDIQFPHRIHLTIPVFENEPSRTFECRIRYRLTNDGILTFTFAFVKEPAITLRDELRTIGENIKNSLPNVTLYEVS